MHISRKLKSGEILIMSACLEWAIKNNWKEISGTTPKGKWFGPIAKDSGLVYHELVVIYEKSLIDKNLLTPRTYHDPSSVRLGKGFRLSSIGIKICKFIQYYDNELK
jgi:hypothetical protein